MKASQPQLKAQKGVVLEEVLRAYFLRAGFFAIRGVPFRWKNEDLTDIDLWLYERPTGTGRQVQICDIKYKQQPKAVERMFWTSGLANALNVDGAYIATTDKRRSLRQLAEKLDLQLIDGTDVQRIQANQTVLYQNRITDEQLIQELRIVDKEFKNKFLQEERNKILAALSEGFGAPSLVRTLEGFRRLASATVSHHPDSKAVRASGRLAYLAAAIATESLDYVSVGTAFRTHDERRSVILDAVRLGALSNYDGQQALKLALALVEKYAPAKQSTATAVERNLKKDLGKIPADIVAEQAIKLLKTNELFSAGWELEMASYQISLPTFDELGVGPKSMLGAFLDYAGIDRELFAHAWKIEEEKGKTKGNSEKASKDISLQSTLFDDR
ncbi:MAG: hypothetical protein OXF97_08760 [Nitrospira sp.]|nr:hypothetical protein [Nitrospira sp.]